MNAHGFRRRMAASRFIPAAAVAAPAPRARSLQTDVEINNTGTEEAEVHFQWLPRGEEQLRARRVRAGRTRSWAEPALRERPHRALRPRARLARRAQDGRPHLQVGHRDEPDLQLAEGETASSFGQGLPADAIRATEMIQGSEPQRIIFLSKTSTPEPTKFGCVNGTDQSLRMNMGCSTQEGKPLETKNHGPRGLVANDVGSSNRVFEDYAPVNGYVDVWADSDDALYYCYGSMLDSETSDPTTILPQVPSDDMTFIPAAALAAGLEGSFFQTDVDLNNVGSTDLTYELLWFLVAQITAIRSAATSSRSRRGPACATPTCSTRSLASSRTRSALLAVEASGI